MKLYTQKNFDQNRAVRKQETPGTLVRVGRGPVHGSWLPEAELHADGGAA